MPTMLDIEGGKLYCERRTRAELGTPLYRNQLNSTFINSKAEFALNVDRSSSPGACNFHTASVKRRFHK